MRRITFVVLSGWILFSPAYRQVFGHRGSLLRGWMPFSRTGTGICQVDYETRGSDGHLDRINRYEWVDGSEHSGIRYIASAGDALSLGRRICDKMSREKGDLRVFVRCPSLNGWAEMENGDKNICAR